eukprot:gb/GFBE01041752.1/.p1 GENE.gb/GFBE01041752.1/~~gb/GFBE01041752.1/.p1  ORF type:complete len:231 (+),score=18.52 gb/GFBE01041752.1/:1-693(+)
MGQVMYSHYGGRPVQKDDFCCVHMGPVEGGKVVSLHCGHSFCLKGCFAELLRHDHKTCPLCRTPIVVMSPHPKYLRLVLDTFEFTKLPREDAFVRIDRLNQYRLIHDGDMRPELWKLHGGVPDGVLSEMHRACRTCRGWGGACSSSPGSTVVERRGEQREQPSMEGDGEVEDVRVCQDCQTEANSQAESAWHDLSGHDREMTPPFIPGVQDHSTGVRILGGDEVLFATTL